MRLRDDNPYNLQWSNLMIVEAAPIRARYSFMTEELIDERLKAVLVGACPDEHMDALIYANIGGGSHD